MKHTVDLLPFLVPNYVDIKPTGTFFMGYGHNPGKIPVEDISEETISKMCDDLKHSLIQRIRKNKSKGY